MRLKGMAVLVVLIAGIALGIGIVMYGPDYIEKYLPKAVITEEGEFEGSVTAKRLEHDRLLVTVSTSEGAILVTFRKKIPEIDLLVEEGDSVTLGISKYRPFIDDPDIRKVRKEKTLKMEPGQPVPAEGPEETSDMPEEPGDQTITNTIL
jgi:hypothetical protein